MPLEGLGAAIVGGVGSTLGTILSNKYAAEREREARQENYKYNEMSANAADRRTRMLYNDLQSPSALLQQYKEAGLSPSLMFSNGVGGSVGQGAQGAGAAGISPTSYGFNPLEAAQVELMHAQAEKTRAETNTENETRQGKVTKLDAEAEQAFAQAGYAHASEEYTHAMTALQNFFNQLNNETYDEQKNKIIDEATIASHSADKLYYEAGKAELEYNFQKETYQTNIEINKEQLKNLVADTLNKESETNLNEAKITEISGKLELAYMNYLQEAQKIIQAEKGIYLRSKEIGLQYQKLKQEINKIFVDANLKEMEIYADMLTNIIDSMAKLGIAGAVTGKKGTTKKKK